MGEAYTYKVQTRTIRVSSAIENIDDLDIAATPEAAADIISGILDSSDADVELFGILVLDGRHRLVGFKVLNIGTETSATVSPSQVFRVALVMGARGLILFHTHPTCDVLPSRDDIELTRRLKDGGGILNVPVHDHIIVSSDGSKWLSLRTHRPEIFS